ncbi:MAG: hypothetical protein [Olavius algarvensis Gamma 1 endosymbiont]|nr:MAG: hypothetical protein [Olavius algarvensis Gamma 1 endosymbiont]
MRSVGWAKARAAEPTIKALVIRVVPVDNSLIYNDIIRFDRPD